MDASCFPPNKAGLSLEHNPHRRVYESVARYTADFSGAEWISFEQREKALSTDCLWVLQWWPDTPVGSCVLAGADLDAVLAAAKASD